MGLQLQNFVGSSQFSPDFPFLSTSQRPSVKKINFVPTELKNQSFQGHCIGIHGYLEFSETKFPITVCVKFSHKSLSLKFINLNMCASTTRV